MEPKEILLVEDDPNLGLIVKEFLEENNFKVELHQDGNSGLSAAQGKQFDLCILDVMLPKKDGFEIATGIRANDKMVPIIFVTAKDKIDDKIKGFDIGGDDYLTKPFSMDELILRINALLKRIEHQKALPAEKNNTTYKIGDFSFNFQLRILSYKDESEKRNLSTKENELLKLLCQHANKVLERQVALKLIWGDDTIWNARSMDVFITRLRKYLKQDERISIMNVHGTGYTLIVPS